MSGKRSSLLSLASELKCYILFYGVLEKAERMKTGLAISQHGLELKGHNYTDVDGGAIECGTFKV